MQIYFIAFNFDKSKFYISNTRYLKSSTNVEAQKTLCKQKQLVLTDTFPI